MSIVCPLFPPWSNVSILHDYLRTQNENISWLIPGPQTLLAQVLSSQFLLSPQCEEKDNLFVEDTLHADAVLAKTSCVAFHVEPRQQASFVLSQIEGDGVYLFQHLVIPYCIITLERITVESLLFCLSNLHG